MESHCFLWEIAAQHLAITWRLPFHQLCIPVSCTTKRHVPQHLFLSFYICRPGCAFCHPLIRIPFLPLCTPPNLFLPSCDGGNLIIVKSLECLLEVQFPVFVHTAVRHLLSLWGSFPHLRSSDLTERPFLCCSTGMLSTLVNKTLLRPHLLEPFHILRWCAVWTLFCVTLPWVVCVCPLSRTAALPAGS